MTHERDLERDRKQERAASASHDVAPGRESTSASMRSPDRPLVSGLLMRKASGEASANPEAAVARANSSSGHGLPDDLRGRFEQSLGTDLSGVRVHTGEDSQKASGAVGAHAYAMGDDIHFAPGQYDPGSERGQHLIAHEVAHTVQQRGASPSRQHKLAISQAGDHHEAEADSAASAMVRGAPASVSSGGVMISRAADPAAKPATPTTDAKKGSFAKQSLGVSLFGKSGTITATEEGANAEFTLGELDLGAAKKTISQSWPFQAPGAPGGVMIKLEGSISASASGSLSASGGLRDFGTGARENADNTMGFSGTVTGSGSIKFEAEGRLSILGYAGVPFMNVNAGGYVKLSGSVSADFSMPGTFEISPDGVAQGNVKSGYSTSISVVGSGGITVGYAALIKEDTLFEVELVSHEFLTGKLGRETMHDFGTGATTNKDTSEELKYVPIQWSAPRSREMEKKDNRDQAAREAENSDGASGGGGGTGLDNYDPPEGDAPGTCDDESSSCAPEETESRVDQGQE